jgi:translation initiation factor 5A
MGDVTLKSAGQFQKGNYIILDGAACVVSSIQISRPGKHGHAKVRLEAVGMVDGKKRQVVIPGHDNMEVPVIGKKNAQVLSVNGSSASVMDMETYETYDVVIPQEMADQIVPGCIVLYWQILNDKVVKQVMKQA